MTGTEQTLPKFDLPVDFLIDENIGVSILNLYGRFPCKIKAAIFALCITGKITVTINLKEYSIGPNDFVTLLPDSFIQIHQASDDARVCFFGFSSQFISHIQFWKKISDYFVLLRNCPIVSLQARKAAIYRDTFSLTQRIGSADAEIALSPPILHSIAELFLQVILEIYRTNNMDKIANVTRDQEILGEFVQLAFQNYMTEHLVTFYAKAIGLSLSHFCATINRACGKTAQEIIARLIILDAKAQLKASNLHVNKIALSLGFTTPTTFNRFFRKYAGMTPEQYRNGIT
jgi:AraC family transcriptional activator of pobA